MRQGSGDRRLLIGAKSWGAPGAYLRAIATTLFVCASFAAVASWVVLAIWWSGAFTEPRIFGALMLVKAIAFTALAAGASIELTRRVPRPTVDPVAPLTVANAPAGFRWELIAIVAVSALLFLPNLHRFPSAAPDELHHLTVARNLAVHGAYASGLAPDRLVYFDHYDSVGAPVIGAVAESFRLLGVSVAAGRVPMALLALAFPLSIYCLFAPSGRVSASVAALATLGASGTIYLGRTLYGEVPALTFLVFGLILWRRGLAARSTALTFAAGLLFGLAVLTKTFLAVATFAFLGAWLLDRATSRQIGWRAIASTAAGGIVPLAAWMFIEYLARDRIGDQPSTLVYYRHMLIAGFEPLFDSPEKLLAVLPTLVLTLILLLIAVPRLFHSRPDPALAVLFLVAPLFAFWWIGFTPMHIPRYLWYTAAIGAAFGGSLLGTLPAPRVRQTAIYQKFTAAALTALIALGYGVPAFRVGFRVYSTDQAAADRALVGYVKDLPPHTRIVTSYWPTMRVIEFKLEKQVEMADRDLYDPAAVVFIDSERMSTAVSADEVEPLRFGHYRVYEGANARAQRLAGNQGK